MIKVLLSSVGLIALASTAAAQDVPAAPPNPEQSQDQGRIEDIVVTASRRAENVQRAALSIQALTSETLARANVSRPEDLASIAPGVQIGSAGPYAQAYVRGVGNYATNSFAESPIAFNLDGVYISRAWATRGMFYDLDRVEVLKGPQGTLYGRNASGGAINVITAKPKLGSVSGFIEGQVGNYNLWQGTAAVNLPIGETVAIRASGQVIDRDGYLSDGYDDDKTRAARLQLLWEPSSDFSLLLNANYQHVGGRGVGGILTQPASSRKFLGSTDNPLVEQIYRAEPGLGPLNVVPQKDGFIDVNVYAIGAEINWNLGFATLTVLPAYREGKLRGLQYTPGFSVRNNEHNRQTSVEARLSNSGDRLKWVLGAYYFNERITNLDGNPTTEVLQGVNAQISGRLDTRTLSYAAFAQATYSLTDRLRLTGGLRYTYERKDDDELLINYSPPSQTPPPTCPPGSNFSPTPPSIPLFCRLDIPITGRLTYNSWTWKAGVEFDVGPDSMAYANASTGFKSGNFYTAPPPNTFKPEKLTAFEAGIKNRFFDNRLQVNLELFYWKYKDHQESYVGPTSVPGIFTFVTVNAGRAKSYGADLDIIFRASPDDDLSLKVQYNKSNYDLFKFQNLSGVFGPPVTGCAVGPLVAGEQTVDCSGLSLIRAPLWSGTAGYSHTFQLGGKGSLQASAEVQFASASYLSIDFLDAGKQEAYAIGNFDLTYRSEDKRWTVSAYVRNIWNQQVFNQVFRSNFVSPNNPLADPDGLFLATARPPRTFGGRIRYNF
jgi:iron complex outermembrane receptor protein